MTFKTLNTNTLFCFLFFFFCFIGNRVIARDLCNRDGYAICPRNKEISVKDDTIPRLNTNNIKTFFPIKNGEILWNSRPLRVGIIKRSWPLATIDNQGNLIGLDSDIMKVVLESLNFNYQIYVGTLKEIEKELENGDIDVIFGYLKVGNHLSPYLFSMPYFYIDYQVAVLTNNERIKQPDDLDNYAGNVAIVAEDQLTYDNFQLFTPKSKIIAYENYHKATESVYRGECQAIIQMDCIPFPEDAVAHQKMHLLENVYYNPRPSTIVVYNGNNKLIDLINNTLFKLIESGDVYRIKSKYKLQDNKLLITNMISRKMNVLIISILVLFLLLIFSMIRLMKKRKAGRQMSNLFHDIINKMPVVAFLSSSHNPYDIEYFNNVSNWIYIKKGKVFIYPEFYMVDIKKRLDKMMNDTWNTGQSNMSVFEVKNKITNKSHFFIIRLVRIKSGYKHRLLVTSIDSTDLINLKKLAEANDHHMTNYLVDVSFEIRTLLNAIVGFSELIPDVTDHNVKEEYLNTIENKSLSLNHLINDVLILSKLESGQYVPTFQQINIQDFQEKRHIQLFEKYSNSNINFILDSYYDWYLMNIDVDLYQIVTEQFMRIASELIELGSIHFGFVEFNEEFVLYISGNDNDYCKKNLSTLFFQILDSRYFGLKNRFPFAIALAAGKLLKAKIGFYETEDNQITIWCSVKVKDEKNYSINRKVEFNRCKHDLKNRWQGIWFELDENDEYKEGSRDEK